MTAPTHSPGPLREMTRDDIDALRDRCLARTGGDWSRAERLVAAYLKGRYEAALRERVGA